MNEYLIEAEGITHAYGKESVLRGLDLKVGRGSIYGFLGRNGAGKSTFIRFLAGLSSPDEGSLRVLGTDPSRWSPETQCKVGYMADTLILPAYMRVSSLIEWTRQLYPDWDPSVIERLGKRFRLDQKKKVYQLSLGQQRQVAFMLALAPKPDLFILDEPAANLDVAARRAFLDEMLGLLREENKTVFFSTHVLSDVERVADHIGILSGGKMCVSETLDALKETVREIRFYWDRTDTPQVRIAGAYCTKAGRGEVLATLRTTDPASLDRTAAAAGCRWEERSLNLEDLFINLTLQEGDPL